MNTKLDKQLQLAKQASFHIAMLSAKKKELLLLAIAKKLEENKSKILSANAIDVQKTKEAGAIAAFIDRLTLTEKGFMGMVEQVKIVANLQDPIGEILEEKNLANGVHLVKRRFPIGVILMIYESRPNVTIDVVGLCIKSGNAVILKGGSEAIQTNRALLTCVREVLQTYDLPQAMVTFLEDASHADIGFLLRQSKYIDVVIPRGSYALTTAVAKQSRIPILYHAAGGARMYVDSSADLQQAVAICVNAKTQRTGVCNALDMVLVHKSIAENFLPLVAQQLFAKEFQIRADKKAFSVILRHLPKDLLRKILRRVYTELVECAQNHKLLVLATKKDFSTEFLDSILAVQVVDSAIEAIDFIKKQTHGHTEILVAQDTQVIEKFIQEVDSAGVMINCSSRLHDGGAFEMGAEMGTATGKLHARGPVGVKELTTYKWIAYGNGQIRT